MKTKITFKFISILILSFSFQLNAAETVLITFDQPTVNEMVSETKWCVNSLPSWVKSHGIVDNPVKDPVKNNTNKCYKVEQAANASYYENFLYFQLKQPITITQANRYLHIKHYRQVLNDEFMVCPNTSISPDRFFWEQKYQGMYRFESQNSKAGQWEDVIVDLKYLMDKGIPLTDFSFGFSMDWNGGLTNPASDYYLDEIILSDSNTARDYTPINYSSFQVGKRWDDNRGMHINAHGGQIIYVDDTYYMIGENRIGDTSIGIACYSSKDMYNWKFESICLEMPNEDIRADWQDVNFGRLLERPKVLYNEKTKKFVMWMHWELGTHNYGGARVAIAMADKITGPFQFVKTMRPHFTDATQQWSGEDSRDQTLFMDDDGKAYHFSSAEMNTCIHISELTDDFLGLKDGFTRNWPGQQYEAPAIFKHTDNKYYGFFSGATSWNPNPLKSAKSDKVDRDWYYINNPCVDNNAHVTYWSQPNYIFKVPGKVGAYIYLGDRWTPANISVSPYIWLPISMRTGRPSLHWYDEWDLSLFDRMNGYNKVTTIQDGKTYYLLAKHSDRFMSLDGTKLTQWKDDDTRNLALTFIATGNGWYKIKNAEGKYLDTSSSLSFASQAQTDAQLWRLDVADDEFFYIYNKGNNQVIDVSDFNFNNGVTLTTWTKKTSDADNQLWGVFEKTNTGTGLFELNNTNKNIEIYPNPSNGNVSLHLRGYGNENTKVFVTDMNGRVFYQNLFQSESMVSLNLSKLNDGVYLVKAISYSGVSTQKLVIKK